MSTKTTNDAAKAFKALHIPGAPLILANVWDATSARTIASLPECKALATASFAVALANGTEDTKLDLDTHLVALRDIAAVARSAGKPLTVDLQDGYGDRLEEAVRGVIDLGVVGINLEDSDQATAAMIDEGAAVARVRRALVAAADCGVPDFVVNARADSRLRGGSLDDSIRRGKLYLAAGATTVYVLGGRPIKEDVEKLVEAFDGRVNTGLQLPQPSSLVKPLTTRELGELGIARVSVGPQIYNSVIKTLKEAAGTIFGVSDA